MLRKYARRYPPDILIHLAAQARVRYSIENPRAYVESNLIGAFNVWEVAREAQVKHAIRVYQLRLWEQSGAAIQRERRS